MKIAGIGFRKAAGVDALRDALAAAGGAEGVGALATAQSKAGAAALLAFARELGLPIRAVAPADLAAVETPTWSDRVAAHAGAGSLAEAAALAAAGPGARLLGPRSISVNGMATAAIAEGPGE